MRALFFIFVIGLCPCLASCSKPDAPVTPTGETPPPPQAEAQLTPEEQPLPPVDACALLTSEEIEAVQGEALKETKPGDKTDRGLVISDCFVTLPTFSKSITLAVAQRGTVAGGLSVKQFWDESVASVKGDAKSGPARKIDGVGDDAYWLGDERMGALFVLQGPRYLRISVGGPGDQAAKIEKCKALARIVLGRL